MWEVDIMQICKDCPHCEAIGDVQVGRDDEGGGLEAAYICLKKQNMGYYVRHSNIHRNDCPCYYDD